MDRSEQVAGLGMSVGRMEAFSDGVLAIVITLLILDVKVPADAGGELGAALVEQWPRYVAYLVSFFVVGVIWLNHHATVNVLARTGGRHLRSHQHGDGVGVQRLLALPAAPPRAAASRGHA